MGGWSVISCYRILGLLCTLFLWYKLEEDIMHYDTLEGNPSSSPVRDWSEESRMFIWNISIAFLNSPVISALIVMGYNLAPFCSI